MKINEVMARDKTRKDHNGNFLGFDPDRKVWVVVPRYEGIGMIRSGELANGVLKNGSKYPEFSPSAAPKPDFQPTVTTSKIKKVNTPKVKSSSTNTKSGPSWMANKSKEWQGIAKQGFKQGLDNIKRMATKSY